MCEVYYEDIEFENSVAAGINPIAVPLSIFIDKGNNISITTYRFIYKNIIDLFEKYSNIALDVEFFTLLLNRMSKPLHKYGYKFDESSIQDILEYNFDYKSSMTYSFTMQEEEVIIIQDSSELNGFTYKTAGELSCQKDNIFDVGAVIIKNGCIVAIAETNDIYNEKGIEIYVETAEKYRGFGYADALAYKLSKYISDLGETILYKCFSDNKASIRVAEKTGMNYLGRRISFVAFN